MLHIEKLSIDMSKQITIYSRRTKTNLIMDIVNIMIVKPNDKRNTL